ncbi:hypothetical protein PCCS19_41840 [Paenibacillus sp. CCS19]|uniref:hypothetical protein n=1 Tax=Paenibacillus sp. CCS19 TaxID=3158387 RepID=UPI00256AC3CF|nr:hypothetical protein [Paenibacillus cellulosilyticus]GMK41128.1 hypothetical protein PCCS19_41840 [Paenibacillus cellulosilyticus]
MATRVYLFVEEAAEASLKLEAWEAAPPEVLRCTDNQRITVRSGSGRHHADIEIECRLAGITLMFSIRDLWQEKSPMIHSMQQSVVDDYEDEDYDYWDLIYPFGVVELYRISLDRSPNTTEADARAFFLLLEHFLLKHFMMYAYLEREIQHLPPYFVDKSSCVKTFTHEGELGYRVRTYG